MSKNLFFSIILPTYNRVEFISKAIDSVVNQEYQNWELIIIDDGSIDNTKDEINHLLKSHKNIKYFYKKNEGRSAARNFGILEAKNKWVCFLDSDDKFHKTHLTKFFEIINKQDCLKGLYFSGLSHETYSSEPQQYVESHNKNLEFVLLNTIGTPRACVHIDILKENFFNPSISIGEDKELWVRILRNYPLFYHRHKTFIEINHPKRSINLCSAKENLKTTKYIIEKNKNFIDKKVKKIILSSAYFNLSKRKIKEHEKLMSFFYTLVSILYHLRDNQTKHKLLILFCLVFQPRNEIFTEYRKNR